MSIRFPLKGVLSYADTGNVGATSVAGGVAQQFYIPQDTDNVVVKLQASVVGGGVSATFQTTDDGGTTWFDVARTSIVSNTANSTLAEWLSIPVISPGITTGVATTSSVFQTAPGSAGASTLGSKSVSGLPIMGQLNRVFLRYTAAVSANALTQVDVKANSQSPMQ